MAAYAEFAKFYDQVMGDRSPLIERVRGYVERYLPAAESLLELGCGTGAVLAGLAPGLRTTGVDRSPEMLATAARKVATASLVEADITTFSLGTRFDVVICVFDTLNHLPAFDDWLAMFGQVGVHLTEHLQPRVERGQVVEGVEDADHDVEPGAEGERGDVRFHQAGRGDVPLGGGEHLR